MTAKILVVDDDALLSRVLKFTLEAEGYRVRTASSGAECLEIIGQWHPDLVVLDVVVPGLDSWGVCHRIREICDAPIMIMAARPGEENEIRALQEGADGYTSKPFNMATLLARVQALLRRHSGSNWRPTAPRPSRITAGELCIDMDSHQVTLHGQPIPLSPTEFRLLVALAESPGKLITREELLRAVWGEEYADQYLHLKMYICYLRQKIEEDPSHPLLILNRRGEGYYLVVPVPEPAYAMA